MKKKKVNYFWAIVLLLSLSYSLAFADAEKIFKENSRAVVVVVTYGYAGEPLTQGSGFIIRQDGVIVTSYHVISKAMNITVKVEGKGLLEVEGLLNISNENDTLQERAFSLMLGVEGLLNIYKENDLVLLKVKADDLPVVRLGDIDKMNIGEKVYVMSSPKGYENTISEGILSGIREIDNDIGRVMQFTAPISEGSSGGAVFNKDGEVIGVVTFLIQEAQNLNFAMPVISVKNFEGKKLISLKEFQKKSEKEYIGWLATKMAETQNWSGFKTPQGKKMEVYREVLRLNPYHVTAHRSLFINYVSEGNREKALEHYEILKRLDPSSAKLMRLLMDGL